MDKKSYAFGMSLASNLLQSGVHGLNFDDFVAGLRDMMTGGDLALSIEEAGEELEKFYAEMEREQTERQAEAGKAAKEEGEKFLAAVSLDPDVHTLKSGLMYKVLKEGSGKDRRRLPKSAATMKALSRTARYSIVPTRGASLPSSALIR